MTAPTLTPLAAAVLHVPPPERALVLGIGDGEAALFLAREFPSARIRAADPSEAAVAAAQARVGLDPEGRLAFRRAAGGSLPYPDEQFDLAIQLLGRPRPAELARVLRRGGRLIVVALAPARAAGLRESLLRRRLRRAGFAPVREEAAGEGKFLIARRE